MLFSLTKTQIFAILKVRVTSFVLETKAKLNSTGHSRMSGDHYSKFIHEKREELTLRDYLAIDRTLLANERSFLAYIRTAFTLFIAAISLMKFFDALYVKMIGEVLLGVSALTFFQGFLRYRAMEHIFAELEVIKQEAAGKPVSHSLATRFLHLSHQLLRVFYR